MKSWRMVAVLVLCLVLASCLACNPFAGEKEEVSQQLVEVVRGDLTISVSGSGNIEVSNEARLAFDIGGRIVEIKVEEGDRVTRGQQVARLDDTSYQQAVKLAEADLESAQNQLQVAEVDFKAAQAKLKVAKFDIEIADYAVWQSEITYRITWEEGGPIIKSDDLTDIIFTDLPGVRLALEQADYYLASAQELLAEGDVDGAQAQLELVQEKLALSEDKTEGRRAHIPLDVSIKVLQLEKAKATLEATNSQVDKAKIALGTARLNIDKAKIALETAEEDIEKTVLVAPLSGVVASVEADEGDTVSTVTTIIHLVDLTTMELKLEVDEIDIAGVKPGQRAIIEVDALPDLPLEGEVAFISSLAKEEAGVVLYEVTIGFGVAEGSGLRVGMSATADIVIDERSNVLLVPDRAIKQDSQGNSMVEVMVNEEIEERPVVTGISDGYQTEIVDGLNEGEVVVERRAKPKPTGMGCALAE